eukprot:gene5149-5657_t
MQYNNAMHGGIPLNDEEPDGNGPVGTDPIMAGQVNSSAPTATLSARPKNRWSDNICDWHKNLFPSCFCVTFVCFGVWLEAQMAHKLRMAKFWTIIYIFLSYWVVSLILVIIYPSTAVMLWMVFIFAWILSIVLRMRLIAVDNINEANQFKECCIGFWCPPCSIAQMARHLYGYKKRLDGDGDPERPDNYGSYNDLEMA